MPLRKAGGARHGAGGTTGTAAAAASLPSAAGAAARSSFSLAARSRTTRCIADRVARLLQPPLHSALRAGHPQTSGCSSPPDERLRRPPSCPCCCPRCQYLLDRLSRHTRCMHRTPDPMGAQHVSLASASLGAAAWPSPTQGVCVCHKPAVTPAPSAHAGIAAPPGVVWCHKLTPIALTST